MTKIKKTCNCVRSYHITRMVHRNCHKNEDFDLLYNVIELIMKSYTPKKKSKFISFQWKEDTFVPVHLCDAWQYKRLLHYNWPKAKKNLQLYIDLIAHIQNWILFRWWDNIFSSPQQMTLGILVDVGRVGSHFIPWQALDLLMVGYVKLGFSWYSWMLHWPLN